MNNQNHSYLSFLNQIKNPCLQKEYKQLIQSNSTKKNKSTQKDKIYCFYQKIINTNNIYYLSSFLFLLSQFISFHMILPLLQIIKKKINDQDILQYIDSLDEKLKKRDSTTIQSQCNKYLFSFQMIKKEVTKRIKKFDSYLDVCCGDGKKTVLFAQLFSVKKINGTDIPFWGPYQNKKKFPFEFQFITEKEELNYPDENFDIITCFLSLHHIQNLNNILQNIYKKLKKKGIFIIIEHDVLNEMDQFIVDIQHMFYSYFFDQNKKNVYNPLYAKYYNRMEWSYIIQKIGFQHIHTENIYENIAMAKRYDNPFYSIFIK